MLIKKVLFKTGNLINDISLSLTPLHALIGPNDTGKTTILQSLQHINHIISPPTEHPPYNAVANNNIYIEAIKDTKFYPMIKPIYLHFDPKELRKPHHLLGKGEPIRFTNNEGYGLPAIYDIILNKTPKKFLEIESKLKELFPYIEEFHLENASTSTKQISIKIQHNDISITAEHISEGILYYLAFTALECLENINFFLIEEPETGLHPARIREVINILREISKKQQILLTTHSPLVINELECEEVTILTRNKEKVTATSLCETYNYTERSQIYSNGELWLSYADGESEHDLLHAPIAIGEIE